MPLSWVAALKKWNEGKSKWCIPRKGSKAHAEVRKIMAEGSSAPVATMSAAERRDIAESIAMKGAPAAAARMELAIKKLKEEEKLAAERNFERFSERLLREHEAELAELKAKRAAAEAPGAKLPSDLVRKIIGMTLPSSRVKEMRRVAMEELTDAQEGGNFYDDWLDYDSQFPSGLTTGNSANVVGVVPDYGAESGSLTSAIAAIIVELHEGAQYAPLTIKQAKNPKGLKKKLREESEAANGFDAVGDSDVFRFTYSLKGTPAQVTESHSFFKDLDSVVRDVLEKLHR